MNAKFFWLKVFAVVLYITNMGFCTRLNLPALNMEIFKFQEI